MKSIYAVVGLILFSVSKHELSTKQVILRNFMARSIKSIESIFSLWDNENYQDCFVLLRGLADRLFHLHDLIENDNFREFEKWSFIQQYEYLNSAKSDEIAKDSILDEFYKASPEDKEKYQRYKKIKPNYKRPEAKDMAKSMGLPMLYKFGYDHASSLVHPMANDGQEDFHTITKLGNESDFPDHRVVLNNALLYSIVLNQKAMGGFEFQWRSIVLDFIDHTIEFLKTGSTDYKTSYLKICQIPKECDLCVPE